MEEPQINLSDSQQFFNDNQLQMFLTVKRSRSNDSLLGQFINGPVYEKRSLVMDFDLVYNVEEKNKVNESEKVKIFKPKIKKIKEKKQCDYTKNICGYITKKIIREYLGSTYKKLTQTLCQKHKCSYQQSKSFYLSRIQKITGPSHIESLVVPTNQSQIGIKSAFKEFFIWFLKQRYLRYLILQGKMDQKKAYIQYKNTTLLCLVKYDGQNQETSSSQVGDSFESSS